MTRVRYGPTKVANVVVALILVVLALFGPAHLGPRLGPPPPLVSLTFAGPAQVIQAGTWAVGELAGSAVRTVGQPATATAQRAVVRLIVVARPARLIVVARPARLVRVVRALVASHRPWLRHLVGGPALIGVVRPLPAEADLLVGIAAILLLLLGIAAPDRARAAGRTGQLWPGSRAPPVPVG